MQIRGDVRAPNMISFKTLKVLKSGKDGFKDKCVRQSMKHTARKKKNHGDKENKSMSTKAVL